MGIEAVAIYSEADSKSLAVRLADAAFCVGPAASSESYLRSDVVLQVALDSGCDAVHPGYGFLSENAEFAKAVVKAGMIWIGPPAEAIESMGSKTAARRTMAAAGVPIVPGTTEPLIDLDQAEGIAADIGYPIMLKASAGGGGKGMRLVHSPKELRSAITAAQSESKKAFGDDAVYMEKAILEPRHVEIQVLADAHSNVVHLFERDCSIQRRHQKVFEETPCTVLKDETRQEMTDAAVLAAKAVNYEGAGTVEFLLSADGEFYFLEMNTRLQVEHPITEMITGIDLVQAQLRVAQGEPLWFTQDDVQAIGHAVECRVYAEDVGAGFRPSPGPILEYREPSGPFVRVDSGIAAGLDVPIHYDPMIAKLVVWGRDRSEALQRARAAISEYKIVGTTTSLPFFLKLFDDAQFQKGIYNTGFINDEWISEQFSDGSSDVEDIHFVAAAVALHEENMRMASTQTQSSTRVSPWRRPQGWSSFTRGR